jgi:protein ImuB
MKYAVLWVKDFPLHALRRGDPALAGRAVALIAGEGRKAVLTEVSPEARGVSPGLTATLAMARCPGIILKLRNPAADTEAHRVLVAAAFNLSPRVEFTGPGCITVDLQGADATATEAQMRRCVADLAKAGLPARIGASETPLLAAYAARCAEPVLIVRDPRAFLDPLPVAVAEPAPAHAAILHGWGIRTLGALTTLAKAEVGRRLGTEGALLWERAAGETTRPLRLILPAKTFVSQWSYEPPVESAEPLLFRLRRFAECLALELRAAGLVAEKLSLTLGLEDGTDYRREFRLPEPGADVDGWLRILQSHLEGVRTPARVTGVCLVATPTRPHEKQDGLFETGLRDRSAFWENLARLGAVVGDEWVGTPVLQDTHRPDAFVLEKPAETVPAPAEAPRHAQRGLVLRRFRPAWPAQVDLADTVPARIRSGGIAGPVTAHRGPWRASGEWWKQPGWTVETWHVELGGGETYQLARTDDGWCIEGVLD